MTAVNLWIGKHCDSKACQGVEAPGDGRGGSRAHPMATTGRLGWLRAAAAVEGAVDGADAPRGGTRPASEVSPPGARSRRPATPAVFPPLFFRTPAPLPRARRSRGRWLLAGRADPCGSLRAGGDFRRVLGGLVTA